MQLTQHHHDHTHTFAHNGLALEPGDTFEPYPQDVPGYLVTFDGVIDGMVHVSDRWQTIALPLDEFTTETGV
jgi:hypothetical protein